MSDAFQQAWSVVKMASYKVGPTEFHDIDEGEFGSSMGRHHFANPDPSYRAKVMMKPQDYLRLVSPIRGWRDNTANEMYGGKLQDYTEDDNMQTNNLIQGMKEGKATFMPYLDINREGKVKNHEGRHRMAAILQLLGNRHVPVQLSSRDIPNLKNSLILDAMKLQGELDEKQKLILEPEMFNVGDVE